MKRANSAQGRVRAPESRSVVYLAALLLSAAARANAARTPESANPRTGARSRSLCGEFGQELRLGPCPGSPPRLEVQEARPSEDLGVFRIPGATITLRPRAWRNHSSCRRERCPPALHSFRLIGRRPAPVNPGAIQPGARVHCPPAWPPSHAAADQTVCIRAGS